MQELSDKELFELIRKDDRAAFQVLFRRHFKVMLGTAINMLKETDVARDVVQEVFFQVWKNRESIELHGSPAAYLKRAVINRSLNEIRSQRPMLGPESLDQAEDGADSPEQLLEFQQLEGALKAALDQLPERCRLIFIMKRLEGLSQKEIAETLDISAKTVENQLTKAIKILKEALQYYRKEKGGDP